MDGVVDSGHRRNESNDYPDTPGLARDSLAQPESFAEAGQKRTDAACRLPWHAIGDGAVRRGE